MQGPPPHGARTATQSHEFQSAPQIQWAEGVHPRLECGIVFLEQLARANHARDRIAPGKDLGHSDRKPEAP